MRLEVSDSGVHHLRRTGKNNYGIKISIYTVTIILLTSHITCRTEDQVLFSLSEGDMIQQS